MSPTPVTQYYTVGLCPIPSPDPFSHPFSILWSLTEGSSGVWESEEGCTMKSSVPPVPDDEGRSLPSTARLPLALSPTSSVRLDQGSEGVDRTQGVDVGLLRGVFPTFVSGELWDRRGVPTTFVDTLVHWGGEGSVSGKVNCFGLGRETENLRVSPWGTDCPFLSASGAPRSSPSPLWDRTRGSPVSFRPPSSCPGTGVGGSRPITEQGPN